MQASRGKAGIENMPSLLKHQGTADALILLLLFVPKT